MSEEWLRAAGLAGPSESDTAGTVNGLVGVDFPIGHTNSYAGPSGLFPFVLQVHTTLASIFCRFRLSKQ